MTDSRASFEHPGIAQSSPNRAAFGSLDSVRPFRNYKRKADCAIGGDFES